MLLVGDALVTFAGCVPAAGDNCQPLHPAPVPRGAVHRLVYKRSTDGGARSAHSLLLIRAHYSLLCTHCCPSVLPGGAH
jgi:hypothetical protein